MSWPFSQPVAIGSQQSSASNAAPTSQQLPQISLMETAHAKADQLTGSEQVGHLRRPVTHQDFLQKLLQRSDTEANEAQRLQLLARVPQQPSVSFGGAGVGLETEQQVSTRQLDTTKGCLRYVAPDVHFGSPALSIGQLLPANQQLLGQQLWSSGYSMPIYSASNALEAHGYPAAAVSASAGPAAMDASAGAFPGGEGPVLEAGNDTSEMVSAQTTERFQPIGDNETIFSGTGLRNRLQPQHQAQQDESPARSSYSSAIHSQQPIQQQARMSMFGSREHQASAGMAAFGAQNMLQTGSLLPDDLTRLQQYQMQANPAEYLMPRSYLPAHFQSFQQQQQQQQQQYQKPLFRAASNGGSRQSDYSVRADSSDAAPKHRKNKSPFFIGNNSMSLATDRKVDLFGTASSSSSGLDTGTERFSRKVFVGGLPPDIDEEEIKASFMRFGPLVVDWPHKIESKSYFPPKGYAFLLFHEESAVQALIDACIQENDKLYLSVSSPTIKDKPVQIRPWRLNDADFVLDSTLALDPRKTVFVGGVPRPLKACELANIMNNFYGGVCYAGIDTDPELKYPKGAGRVAFSNHQSYINAISGRFIHLQLSEIERRVEVKPYVLDDQFCDECQGARCGNKFAPFFCANISCLRYYCQNCWSSVHSQAGKEFHKPLVKEGADRPRGGAGSGNQHRWS